MALAQLQGNRTTLKVAEIFMTAGTAFNRLGELAMDLSDVSQDRGSRWTESEIGPLKAAIERFAADLSQISDRIKLKSKNAVKADLKTHQFAKPSGPTILLGKRKQPETNGDVQSKAARVVTVANLREIQEALKSQSAGGSLVNSVVAGLKSQPNVAKIPSVIPHGVKAIVVKGTAAGAKVRPPVTVTPGVTQGSAAHNSNGSNAANQVFGYGLDEHFEDEYEGEVSDDEEDDEDFSEDDDDSGSEEEGEIIT